MKFRPEQAAATDIQCLNKTTRRQFKVVTIKLRSLNQDVIIELCISQFPWEQPKKELKDATLIGYPRTVVPSAAELRKMPKILLGIRAALLLPEPVAKN